MLRTRDRDPAGPPPCPVPTLDMMAAHKSPEPGVYRFFGLIEGRSAFFYIDWRGVEHPLRIVGEDDTEAGVIAELEEAMGPRPSRSRSARPDRPPLFLL
jgi:hypothetical protein